MSDLLKLYAIRHKPSGYFMPARTKEMRRNKGFTYSEPTANCVPRLFTRYSYAVQALKWWLKGQYVFTPRKSTPYGFYDGELTTVNDPRRKAEEMEIVIIQLQVLSDPDYLTPTVKGSLPDELNISNDVAVYEDGDLPSGLRTFIYPKKDTTE